jgi:hypothetical protein
MKKVNLFLFLLIGCTAFGQGGVMVDPMKVEFNLNKGTTATQNIRLTNALDQTVQFRLYLGDWMRDSTGGHVYMDANTIPSSCARWISLDQEFVELGPKESKTIAIRLNLPDSNEAVNAMKWAMLFVENTKENIIEKKSNGVGTTFKEVFRLGIHVYQTPPTLVNKEIRMLSFDAVNDSTYAIACKNLGEVQVKCISFMEMISLTDGSKQKISPVEFPMFPGQKRTIQFKLPPAIAKGKYTIIGVVDAGEELPLEAAQLDVEIK